MSLIELKTTEEFVGAISEQAVSLSKIQFSEDFKKLFLFYLETFKDQINSMDWDFLSIEFWFDSGQLILYPESFEYERLDPYMCLVFQYYQIYFDQLITQNISDEVLEEESMETKQKVIDCVNGVLKELSTYILAELNRKKIYLKYFGVTKEFVFKEEVLGL
ncbi:hypothetical protein F4U02_03570 [Acinetobacter haemolyticus]|uniref:hypothetical protein n=1 Tax=Acinetobacter haemolyticus TaxID=29430 RepID=UPI0012985F6F|nr:hypothetical protein [Acinetobacter haemolyticus]MQZ30098.1 hypothetical protein [Acinetobacter haemolyticus]